MKRLWTTFFITITLVFQMQGESHSQVIPFAFMHEGKLPEVDFTMASQNIFENDANWGAPGNDAWTKRIRLEFDNGAQTENLINFPVMVKLNSARINYADTKDAGEDIRFFDNDGTALKYEIEKWDEAGDSYVWVKIPQVDGSSSSDHIFMYYGNAAAADAQDATNVWNADYKSIHHLGADTNDTKGTHNGTNNNTVNISGQVFDGQDFDGVDGTNITVADHADFSFGTGDLTISAWINPDALTAKKAIIDKTDGTNGFRFLVSDGGGSRLKFIRGANFASGVQSGAILTAGSWQHVAVTVSSNEVSFYRNGILDGSAQTISGNTATVAIAAKIGEKAYAGSTVGVFNGSMDEFRIASGARSADWIKAQYLSMADNFIIYHPGLDESIGRVRVTVTMDKSSPQNVTVPYTVTGTSTKLPGPSEDHELVNGNVVVNAGNTTATFNVNVLRDDIVEGDETIIVTMGNPTNADKGTSITVHTISILDELIYDVVPPAVTIEQAASQTEDPTKILPIEYTITFSEQVNPTTFTTSDITQNGTVPNVTWDLSTLDNVVWTLKAIDIDDNGTIIPSLAAAVVKDLGGNDNVASTSTDNSVTFNSGIFWIGAGGDTNWNNTGNWAGGSVPGSSDVAVFNGYCGGTCDANINVALNTKGILMSPSYTGTITQNAGQTITVGTDNWVQRAGTFTGGDSLIDINNYFTQSGGSFTSTTGLMDVRYRINQTGTATFANNNGSLKLGSSGCGGAGVILEVLPATEFNNFEMEVSCSYGATINSDVTINGLWTIDMSGGGSDNISNSASTFHIKGNILDLGFNLSSPKVLISGSTPQTIDSQSGNGAFRNFEINTTSTLDFIGPERAYFGSFNYVAGTVTWSAAGVRLGKSSCVGNAAITTNGLVFPDTLITKDCGFDLTLNDVLSINGNLEIDSSGNTNTDYLGANIEVTGDVTLTFGVSGTSKIVMNGTTDQTFTYTAGQAQEIIVNKSSGKIIQATNVTLSLASSDLTIQDGTWDMAGFDLTVNDQLNIGDGVGGANSATLTQNGGTIVSGSTNVDPTDGQLN